MSRRLSSTASGSAIGASSDPPGLRPRRGDGRRGAVGAFALRYKPAGWERRLTPSVPIVVTLAVVLVCFVAPDFAVRRLADRRLHTRGAYEFVSAPALHPPIVRADVSAARPVGEGLHLYSPNFYDPSLPATMVGQSGPLILDQRLSPVWFRPVPENDLAGNLSLQTYEGRPVLAWWQGVINGDGLTTSGEYVVVDQHYRPVARLRGADGWVLTLHEIVIRGDDAWVTASKNVRMNLSRYGGARDGARRRLRGSGVQPEDREAHSELGRAGSHPVERLVDPCADERLPLGRLPRQLDRAAGQRQLRGLDAQHLGRVQGEHRHRQDRVDARREALELPVRIRSRVPVAAQRGGLSRYAARDRVRRSLLPGHGRGHAVPPTGPSRGLVLKLDPATPHRDPRRPVHPWREPSTPSTWATSSHSPTATNSSAGAPQPRFSEYTASGRMVLDAVLPGPDITYRATVEPWVGLPLYPPSGAARQRRGKDDRLCELERRHEVSSWRVLAGSSSGA